METSEIRTEAEPSLQLVRRRINAMADRSTEHFDRGVTLADLSELLAPAPADAKPAPPPLSPADGGGPQQLEEDAKAAVDEWERRTLQTVILCSRDRELLAAAIVAVARKHAEARVAEAVKAERNRAEADVGRDQWAVHQ